MKNNADENGFYVLGTKLVDASFASGVVVVPDNITEIGEYAFYGNKNITEITIPDSVGTIGNYAFGTSITKLTIPCSFDNYTTYAFSGCTSLRSLVLTKGTGTMPSFNSESCNYIHTPWYYSASNLKSIIIESGVNNIGYSAFNGLTALTSLELPDGLKVIDNLAFSSNKSLTNVILPDSLENVNAGAFNGCSGIKELTMPCSAVIAPYTSTFGGCTNIEKITLTKGTGMMPSFYSNYKCTPWYLSRSKLNNLVLEEGIINIGSHMFYQNTSFSYISLPNSISSIGTFAFSGCTNLTSIELNENLETIYDYAFENTGLTEIVIGKNTLSIKGYAFYNCKSLQKAYLLNKDTTIVQNSSTLPTNTTIYGYDNSTAQSYANKYNRTFVEIYGVCSECGSYNLRCAVTNPTCVDGGYSTLTCNDCGNIFVADYTEATGHTIVVDSAVSPTCTETGLTEGSHCSVCGYVFVAQENVNALGHNKVVDDAVEPTCTKTGLTEGSHCSTCNEVFVAQKTIAKLGHSYSSLVTKEPTCTQTGIRTYTCVRCGDQYTEIIFAKGHTVVNDKAVAATCTETGLTAGTHCSVCGEIIKAQQVTNALGHKVVVDSAVQPTCTETGLTEGSHCSVCGAIIVAQETVYALGHNPVVDDAVAPTCTETGLTEGSHCSVCGYVIVNQKRIVAPGHKAVVDSAVLPTCTETGLTEGSHCSVCGEVLVAQNTVNPLGHSYESRATRVATCTTTGVNLFTCVRCGDQYSEIIPTTDHIAVIDDAVAATCTTKGKTQGSHCSVCGMVIIAQETIEAKGHRYDAGVITKEPTCTASGLKTYTCYECGNIETETLKACGHTIVNDPAVSASCTSEGKTSGSHCSVCGEVFIEQQTIPASGHSWNSGKITKIPTCTEDGEITYTCYTCKEKRIDIIVAEGHIEIADKAVEPTCTQSGLTAGSHCSECGEILVTQESVPALGHTMVYDEGIPATCTESGKTTGSHCIVCGQILVEQETIGALGHSWDDGIVITEATYDNAGEKKYTCTVCGETKTEVIAKLEHRGKFTASHIESRANRNISVEIFIDENPGITSLSIDVAYPQGLTLNSVDDERLFNNGISKGKLTSNPFTISWYAIDSSDTDATGVFVTLNFTIDSDMPVGDYPIVITYNPENIFNHNLENVGFDIENGSVSIVDTLPGDINNDNAVNMKDVVLLQQYINKWDVVVDKISADVNDDGKVNMKDIVLIQQYINGWDVVLK